MNLKARINKLVKEFPEITEQKVIEKIIIYGGWPSEEEDYIALNKANELIVNSLKVIVWYLPYVHKHIFQYRWGSFLEMEWNQKLGLYTVGHCVIKLVEKYDKPFSPSFIGAEPIFVITLKVQPNIHKDEMFKITDTSTQLLFYPERAE
jgi:hypothetical protein